MSGWAGATCLRYDKFFREFVTPFMCRAGIALSFENMIDKMALLTRSLVMKRRLRPPCFKQISRYDTPLYSLAVLARKTYKMDSLIHSSKTLQGRLTFCLHALPLLLAGSRYEIDYNKVQETRWGQGWRGWPPKRTACRPWYNDAPL